MAGFDREPLQLLPPRHNVGDIDLPLPQGCIVKNTFLEVVDEAPGPEKLDRAKTAPPDLEDGKLGGRDDILSSLPSPQRRLERLASSDEEGGSRTGEVDDSVPSPEPRTRKTSDVEELHQQASGYSQRPFAYGMSSLVAPADAAANGPPLPSPLPQTLTCRPTDDGWYEVCWTADGRKLRNNDKQCVSPAFDMNFCADYPKVTFKIMIQPKSDNNMDDSRTGGCFKRSSGYGIVQLKCEGDLSNTVSAVDFRLAIGNAMKGPTPDRDGSTPWRPEGNALVRHNFAQSALCGLPKTPQGSDVWRFLDVVDKPSMTFNVYLQIKPLIRQQHV